MAKTAKIKTTENAASVDAFIAKLPGEQQQKDAHVIAKLMAKATGDKPKMWGPSIIGFGNLRHVSPKTGREIDWMKIAFSPRKTAFSLYLMSPLANHADDLAALGKYKLSGGCLHIKKMADIDVKVLDRMIRAALAG